jgi:hypothetical protein
MVVDLPGRVNGQSEKSSGDERGSLRSWDLGVREERKKRKRFFRLFNSFQSETLT